MNDTILDNNIPELSVVIAHTLEFPERSLQHVLSNTAFCKYDVFVIVSMFDKPYDIPKVDNKMAKIVNDVNVINTKDRTSFPESINIGVEKSMGKYIGIVPGDMDVNEKWNHPQMLALKRNPDWGFVCGCCLNHGFPDGHTEYIKLLHLAGTIFTRESWNNVGGFDLAYKDGKGFDDDDLFLRYVSAGYRPKLLDYHTISEQNHPLNLHKKIFGAKGEWEMFLKNRDIFILRWGVNGTGRFREMYAPIHFNDVKDVVRRNVYDLGNRIIDIGSGSGDMFGMNSVNFDINEYDAPNFLKGDAHKLPFDNDDFDVAVLCEILEHVDDPLKVLTEALRVSKHVVCTIPNESEYIVERWMHPKTEQDKQIYTEKWIRDSHVKSIVDGKHIFHIKRFKYDDVKTLFESSGCKHFEIKDIEVPYYIGWLVVAER